MEESAVETDDGADEPPIPLKVSYPSGDNEYGATTKNPHKPKSSFSTLASSCPRRSRLILSRQRSHSFDSSQLCSSATDPPSALCLPLPQLAPYHSDNLRSFHVPARRKSCPGVADRKSVRVPAQEGLTKAAQRTATEVVRGSSSQLIQSQLELPSVSQSQVLQSSTQLQRSSSPEVSQLIPHAPLVSASTTPAPHPSFATSSERSRSLDSPDKHSCDQSSRPMSGCSTSDVELKVCDWKHTSEILGEVQQGLQNTRATLNSVFPEPSLVPAAATSPELIFSGSKLLWRVGRSVGVQIFDHVGEDSYELVVSDVDGVAVTSCHEFPHMFVSPSAVLRQKRDQFEKKMRAVMRLRRDLVTRALRTCLCEYLLDSLVATSEPDPAAAACEGMWSLQFRLSGSSLSRGVPCCLLMLMSYLEINCHQFQPLLLHAAHSLTHCSRCCMCP